MAAACVPLLPSLPPRLGRLTLLGYASHSDLLLCLIQALVQQQSAVSVARIARKEAASLDTMDVTAASSDGGGSATVACRRRALTAAAAATQAVTRRGRRAG